MGEVEASELGLAWTIRTLPQLLEIPVVERAMAVEFERAERMGGAFDRIGLPVGPVVGGIHLPAVTGTEVVLVANAVHHGITHLHVLVVHVDLRPQHTEPSSNSPAVIRAKRSRFSSTLRSRQGESTPGVVKPPWFSEIVSASWSST